MRTSIPNGLLLVFDGPDSIEKSCLIEALASFLGERGLLFSVCREPHPRTATESSLYCLGDGRHSVSEDHLSSVEHVRYVERCVVPTLAEGGVVIVDSSYPPFLGYQRGEERGKWAGNTSLRPDLQIVVDAPNSEETFSSGGLRRFVPDEMVSDAYGAEEFHRAMATHDNVILIDGADIASESENQLKRAVLGKIAKRIAGSHGFNADSINSIIEMLSDPEEIWGLWPELDEILRGSPHCRRTLGQLKMMELQG